MKVLTADKIKQADAYTIEHEPIASIDLMERAASACTDWILEHHQKMKGRFIVFAGPGNNGGDGLVIARFLSVLNFSVQVNILKFTSKFSDDFSVNLERLQEKSRVTIRYVESTDDLPDVKDQDVIIDAIFGSGLSRPMEKFPKEVGDFMNQTRAQIIAIDIPSGLFAEEAVPDDADRTIVKATDTLTFQFPKLSFFFRENRIFTGNWYVLPIGLHEDFIHQVDTPFRLMLKDEIIPMLKIRDTFAHKGTFGRGLLISGSYGMMGAAILATRAAIRSGIGLITTHVPHFGYSIIQGAVPEAILSIDESEIIFTDIPDLSGFSAVGAGPALGTRINSQKALKKLLETAQMPLVLDADALNILAKNKEWLELLPPNTVLTPHPKEFERISEPVTNSYKQFELQQEFSKKYNVIVVVKGAYTRITSPDGFCYFNSTGNPGMATGGTGDVLTGIILSLLAQKYDPLDAALCGTYIHGLAGDIAANMLGEEAMIASDIIDSLGEAFKKLKSKDES
jgi:NAD(P)H-hydrate epimerase